MSVTAINLQRTVAVDIHRLVRHASLALEAARKPGCDLSIVIVNDQRMRFLNRTYRGKSKTTDVLSFPVDIPLPEELKNSLLGEIVISAHRALFQAKVQEISLNDEITNLAIHGICHLLGYDHELGEEENRKMRAEERKIADMIRRKDHTLNAPGDITGKIPEIPEQRKLDQ